MSEETSPFNFIFVVNSLLTIGLILNQNESTKDSATKQNQSSASNPLEKITWVCITLQLVLLLIKVKLNN
jgi:preprotein translocase subunit SecG